MKRALLSALQQARGAKRPAAVATDLESGRQALVLAEDVSGDLALGREALGEVRATVAAEKSGILENHGLFVRVYAPPLRMIIVGAVHIAQILAPMARLAGYEVVIVDPRHAWATDERFAGVALDRRWPDEALRALEPDSRTALVVLTHDPKLDDPALTVGLGSPAFYIGALGSRRTHAKRLERLAAQGLDEAALARVHAPIGLDIGASSPAEIAVSILAAVTAELRSSRYSSDN
jgi:xanthine dehydrogenase accessory factor